MWSILDKSWVQIKIAFDVRDDFRKTGKSFDLPDNVHELPSEVKRRMTMCNLYANNGQTIEELCVYFEIPRSRVISILIEEGLLEDQRRRHQERIKGGRRESDRTHSQASESENLQSKLVAR